MSRKRIGLVVVLAVALFGALITGSLHWTRGHSAAAPAKFAPVPEGTEHLNTLETYWNNRITYPTGRFNPAWLRAAARQADRIPRRAPANSAGSNWTALGPKPERMDGCTGCYNYHKTEGRINSIAVDPTTTTNPLRFRDILPLPSSSRARAREQVSNPVCGVHTTQKREKQRIRPWLFPRRENYERLSAIPRGGRAWLGD